MTADGRLGRKNGRGFYRYEDGKRLGPDESVYQLTGVSKMPNVDEPWVERRLVYAMLNEAALAEADGVIRSPRDGDIGAIFGIGFPPFRGGPLRMSANRGVPFVRQSPAAQSILTGMRATASSSTKPRKNPRTGSSASRREAAHGTWIALTGITMTPCVST